MNQTAEIFNETANNGDVITAIHHLDGSVHIMVNGKLVEYSSHDYDWHNSCEQIIEAKEWRRQYGNGLAAWSQGMYDG